MEYYSITRNKLVSHSDTVGITSMKFRKPAGKAPDWIFQPDDK